MDKKTSKLIVIVFCIFIMSIGVLSFILPYQDFSELENRYLSIMPKLSWRNVSSGKYMNDLDSFSSDHIAGRNMWVCIKSVVQLFTGKHENNNVYFADDGYLIKRTDTVNNEFVLNNTKYINEFTNKVDANVYIGIIPTNAYVLNKKLPPNAPTENEQEIINKIYINSNATSLDILDTLIEHNSEEIYYHTDHHLTSLGSYYIANLIFQKMNLDNLSLNDCTKKVVSDSFYGSNYSYSCAFWAKPDTIETYVNDKGISCVVYKNGVQSNVNMYAKEYLDKKDKYSYFLGGNQPLIVLKNSNITNNSKVLVIRDSYTSSIAPFLAQRFSEVHLIDLRYSKTNVSNYIKENSITDVIVLYGFSTYATDKNLVFLKK